MGIVLKTYSLAMCVRRFGLTQVIHAPPYLKSPLAHSNGMCQAYVGEKLALAQEKDHGVHTLGKRCCIGLTLHSSDQSNQIKKG